MVLLERALDSSRREVQAGLGWDFCFCLNHSDCDAYLLLYIGGTVL